MMLSRTSFPKSTISTLLVAATPLIAALSVSAPNSFSGRMLSSISPSPSSSFATSRSRIAATMILVRCLARRGLVRFSSTEAAAPPLLSKIRNDLKTAMKSKDTSRLNVLRSVIAEAGNASKTSSPIRTNMQVLSILRKKLSASKTASQEFAEAKRDDLKQKQDAEIAVLDEYAGQVETFSEDKIIEAVEVAVKAIEASGAKSNAGMVLRELFRPGGGLEDKPVEKAQVAAIVKRRLA